jgi:hypothetical protein
MPFFENGQPLPSLVKYPIISVIPWWFMFALTNGFGLFLAFPMFCYRPMDSIRLFMAVMLNIPMTMMAMLAPRCMRDLYRCYHGFFWFPKYFESESQSSSKTDSLSVNTLSTSNVSMTASSQHAINVNAMPSHVVPTTGPQAGKYTWLVTYLPEGQHYQSNDGSIIQPCSEDFVMRCIVDTSVMFLYSLDRGHSITRIMEFWLRGKHYCCHVTDDGHLLAMLRSDFDNNMVETEVVKHFHDVITVKKFHLSPKPVAQAQGNDNQFVAAAAAAQNQQPVGENSGNGQVQMHFVQRAGHQDDSKAAHPLAGMLSHSQPEYVGGSLTKISDWINDHGYFTHHKVKSICKQAEERFGDGKRVHLWKKVNCLLSAGVTPPDGQAIPGAQRYHGLFQANTDGWQFTNDDGVQRLKSVCLQFGDDWLVYNPDAI